MSVISVRKLNEYDMRALREAVEAHLNAVTHNGELCAGMRVVLKPNLVTARHAENAATTHPLLIRAVCDALRDRGVSDITIADSPGGPYVPAALKTVYAVTGVSKLADVAQLNYDTGWKRIETPEAYLCPDFNIINPLLQADYIINLPKLKTHSLTLLSGSVKNMFGSIPGLQKPELHYRFKDIESFSRMLAELCVLTGPRLTIMDAVDTMEGNGPTGGKRRFLGLTIASRDPFALDWYAAGLMGIESEKIDMLRIGRDRGFFNPDENTIMGDEPDFDIPPYELPDTAKAEFLNAVPPLIRKPVTVAARALVRPLPKLDKSKCCGCGKCAEICPAKIVRIKNGKAGFTKKNCISCFCCQEMCPMNAIRVKRRLK